MAKRKKLGINITKKSRFPVPHKIGPGKRSVLTIHRNIIKDIIRQKERKLNGRYAWR